MDDTFAPMLNDFDRMAAIYARTDSSPDKRYAVLPAILSMLGDIRGRSVLDLGCGDGFFTSAIAAAGARCVFGVDISDQQLLRALARNQHPNVKFQKADCFHDLLPSADVCVAPFISNYSEDPKALSRLYHNVAASLSPNGVLAAVVDIPNNGSPWKKYGTEIHCLGTPTDATPLHVNLYSSDELLVQLTAYYFYPTTIARALADAGFEEITWCSPIVSQAGFEKYGGDFWSDYLANPGFGFVKCRKG